MNPKLRKYGVIGLYVALAAALTALGLYIVFQTVQSGRSDRAGFHSSLAWHSLPS